MASYEDRRERAQVPGSRTTSSAFAGGESGQPSAVRTRSGLDRDMVQHGSDAVDHRIGSSMRPAT